MKDGFGLTGRSFRLLDTVLQKGDLFMTMSTQLSALGLLLLNAVLQQGDLFIKMDTQFSGLGFLL
ncbi:MAG TPA: hypothetical protein VJ904_02235, partial [Tichowtungia sp.]|nr:hypothetical protein [Tichowtungia sp.]